jgi:diguanylate cyclase (GGDEF)-like protein/PAS domain S-box-containing protein
MRYDEEALASWSLMTHPARLPDNELERLAALRQLEVLDSSPEPAFEALVKAASLVCDTPISLISLVDAGRQWFKANIGLPQASETPRDIAFCAHAVLHDELFEVSDATLDVRFARNPLVTSGPGIRFYAGMPLTLSDGHRVGTLCVIDRVARELSPTQREILRCLGLAAAKALEMRRTVVQEARASAVLVGSLDAVIGEDDAGKVVLWNPAAERLFGYPASERLGRDLLDLEPADLRGEMADHWHQTLASRQGLIYETRRLHRDGSEIAMSISLTPVFDAVGRFVGATKVVRDLRPRLRQEQALQASESRYRVLTDMSPLGVFASDAEGGCTYVNERWQQIYGLSAASALGSGWAQALHPDDRQLVFREWQRCAELKLEFDLEFRVQRGDASVRTVRSRARPVLDGLERVQSFVGTVEDVTGRWEADRQLQRSQELLDQTNRLAGVGGWEMDLLTQCIVWSEETCRIHGVEPGYVPDLTHAIEFYPPEARPVIEAAAARAATDGIPWDVELPLIRVNGERIWVRATGTAEIKDGKAVRLFGAFQDISERVAARRALELAHERVTLATQSGGIGVWEYYPTTGELLWDPRMYELYGVPPGQSTVYETWSTSLHPDDRQESEARLAEALAGGRPYDIEFRIRAANGKQRHIRGTARITRDQGGNPLRMTGVNWDVTESKLLQQEVHQKRELLEVTLQSIGDAVITTDAVGTVTWMNPVAERMTGSTTDEARGRPLEQVFHIVNADTRLPTENPVATCIRQGKVVGLANHTLLLCRDGTEHGIEDSAAPIRNLQGAVLGVVLVFHDVTEQRRLSGEMSYRATHDDLTGLLNRAEFEARLNRVLKQSHEDRSSHALFYIDLDQFKLVNDACGHTAGDQLLQQVSKLLADTVRSRDTLARLGGDEFAAILEHCTDQQALIVAQKICDLMEVYRFEHDGKRFRVGASIGLVPVDSRWNGSAAILQAADSSCYAAKEAGRNRVHVWLDTDHALRTRHGEMQWTTRIEQALDQDRFELFGQRIVPLSRDEAGLHAEVLLRMRDTDGSLIPPGAFLPAAERFHLMTRIDRWVLKATLGWLQIHAGQVHGLSMNLSGQSLGDRAFHRHAVEQLGLLPAATLARLCFEITETAAITNLADAALFIEQVRALGVRVALDDFGAGMSSFGYLKSLPVNTLKIDGQFVKDLLDDALDHAAVRSFVEVARLVNMDTVAEFVETQAVHDELRRLGVTYAQGYLLHRPEPLQALLRSTNRFE